MMSASFKLRRLWLNVHLWIGVGLLAAFLPLAVSGAILVWHDAIDRAVHSDRYAVSGTEAKLPVSAYAAVAQAAFGGRAALSQIRLPQEDGDPVVAVGRLAGPPGPNGRPRSLNVWIDPPTGKILSTGEPALTFTQAMHRLHGSLMIPRIGRKVVGWLGWAMFASCATGLWLWWPRNGALLRALRWRRGDSQLFNLHHMLGFWICIPLAVLSLSGVYISFPQTSRALFGVANQGSRGGERPGGGGRFAPPLAPQLPIDDALAGARAAADGQVVGVTLPTSSERPAWRIQIRRKGLEDPLTVQVEDDSGRAKVDGGAGPRDVDRLSPLMRRIHDGSDMGPAWRAVITLAGLAPVLLGLTGVAMWLRRRSRRRAVAAAAP